MVNGSFCHLLPHTLSVVMRLIRGEPMSYQNILTERVDKIAVITMNRPEKLNALSYELACEIDEELTKIESDDEVRAVILTGAGPRAFSAGGDIMQMVKSTPEEIGRASCRER